jgi:hypothetical protein
MRNVLGEQMQEWLALMAKLTFKLDRSTGHQTKPAPLASSAARNFKVKAFDAYY